MVKQVLEIRNCPPKRAVICNHDIQSYAQEASYNFPGIEVEEDFVR